MSRLAPLLAVVALAVAPLVAASVPAQLAGPRKDPDRRGERLCSRGDR